jgi:C4-dicarboxylate-specific signal transduction histidine kinase
LSAKVKVASCSATATSIRRHGALALDRAAPHHEVTVIAAQGVSRAVNQPLSGIVTNASTWLRMLAADPANVSGAQETARRAIRDANRAADIIARLPAFLVKKEAPTSLVDLNDASREVISLSLRGLESSQVILRSEFAEDLPPVKGDRIQLQQVLLNLIRNASDAMSSLRGPRQLVVKTTMEPVPVLVTVQDFDPGIHPANLHRLFDAFYTTKPDGLGMGLAICRTIVEAHGGKLWADSVLPQGAIFRFILPAAAERA